MAEFLNALIPLIAGFVRDHIDKHGRTPTDDEVKQWLATDTDAVAAVGEAWLAAHQ